MLLGVVDAEFGGEEGAKKDAVDVQYSNADIHIFRSCMVVAERISSKSCDGTTTDKQKCRPEKSKKIDQRGKRRRRMRMRRRRERKYSKWIDHLGKSLKSVG